MVRMPRLPIRKNHHTGAKLSQNPRNLQPVFERVLNVAIRQIESLAMAYAKNLSCSRSLGGTFSGTAPGSRFALRQIENAGAQLARSHSQQRPTAGLFHIIAVRGDSQHVDNRCRSGFRPNGGRHKRQ